MTSPSATKPTARSLVAVLAALLVVGLVAGAFVSHGRSVATSRAHGASSSPPWPAPAGLAVKLSRARLAGLGNVYGQRLAEHIHTHLTITIDGQGVTVPGQIGLDEAQRFATSLHTHNTSGIVHIESPVRRDFTLGQFFTEWDVRLDATHVGGAGGDVGEQLTVFVDGRRRTGDPASIVLRDLDDIDLVVAPAGQVVHPAPAFAWPSNYHRRAVASRAFPGRGATTPVDAADREGERHVVES